MVQKICLIAVLAIFIQFVSCNYKAAVFEHFPYKLNDPKNTIIKNIEVYVEQIEKAKNDGVDIVVFPEYGLTGIVDNPQDYSIELPELGETIDNDLLIQISNAAKTNTIYLVVNLLEKATDAKNKTLYYNTNVVFDRNGFIVVKYRKVNLFKESNLTPGSLEKVTFTSDFGVTFGLITGSDLLFYTPSKTLLSSSDVTDIVYPTAWYSSSPFFVSLSLQAGYSKSTGTNLLAASLKNPSIGIGGSGIYTGDGGIAGYYISGVPTSSLVTQPVTTQKNRTESCAVKPDMLPFNPFAFGPVEGGSTNKIEDFKLNRMFKASNYNFRDLDLTKGNIKQKLCHNKFCCNFDITVTKYDTTISEVYKLMAFDGSVTWDQRNVKTSICSVLACDSNDKNTCGNAKTTTTIFKSISIFADVTYDSKKLYQPTTLRGDLVPVSNLNYCDNSFSNGSMIINLSTSEDESNVIVFGILVTGSSSAATFVASFVALALMATVFIV